MRHRRLATGTLLLAIAGCGAAGQVADRDKTTAAATSRLVIHEERPDGGPMYIEGSFGYLRVAPVATGDDLQATQVPTAAPGERALLYDERLAPGEYRVASYQRPCDGNCDYLDPPVDQCATTIRLEAGEPLRLTIVARPGSDCQIVEA